MEKLSKINTLNIEIIFTINKFEVLKECNNPIIELAFLEVLKRRILSVKCFINLTYEGITLVV
jgi:hypothetical protein